MTRNVGDASTAIRSFRDATVLFEVKLQVCAHRSPIRTLCRTLSRPKVFTLTGSPRTRSDQRRNTRPSRRSRRAAWMVRISASSPLLGGYDEPEILRSSITQICPIGADARQQALSGHQRARLFRTCLMALVSVRQDTLCFWRSPPTATLLEA